MSSLSARKSGFMLMHLNSNQVHHKVEGLYCLVRGLEACNWHFYGITLFWILVLLFVATPEGSSG